MSIFLGKDVWILDFILNNDCAQNDRIHGKGVWTWIFIGPLVHLLTTMGTFILACCHLYGIMESVLTFDEFFLAHGFFFILGYLFCNLWMIDGFVLYSKINKNNECADMVLTWSLLQMTETMLEALFGCLVFNPLELLEQYKNLYDFY